MMEELSTDHYPEQVSPSGTTTPPDSPLAEESILWSGIPEEHASGDCDFLNAMTMPIELIRRSSAEDVQRRRLQLKPGIEIITRMCYYIKQLISGVDRGVDTEIQQHELDLIT